MNLKKMVAVVLCLVLATGVLSSACAAEGTYDVTATVSGFYNVPFSNGYNGFCIDHDLDSTSAGYRFMERDTSYATNNLDGSPIGEYLKILFVQNADTFFNKDSNGEIVPNASAEIHQRVWNFSDGNYTASYSQTTQEVLQLKANGMSIPDSGMEPILLDGTTWITFKFMVLHSENTSVNDFFAYQISTVDGYTPPSMPPATGDAAPLALWAMLAGTSFAGMLLVAGRKRRVKG